MFQGLDCLLASPLHVPGPRSRFHHDLVSILGLVFEDVRQDPACFHIPMRCSRGVHVEELDEGLAGSVIALQVLLDHRAPVVKARVALEGLAPSGTSTQEELVPAQAPHPKSPGDRRGAQGLCC